MGLELDDLRADATAQALVNALDQALVDLGNIPGASQDLDRVIQVYVDWARDASIELSRVLSPAAVEDWIYSDRHWRLREMPTRSHLPTRDYLQQDLDRRKRELTELQTESRQAAQRWAGTGVLVVLDTNLLIDVVKRVGSLADVDWNVRIDGYNEDAFLVIPLVVLQELDRLKRTQQMREAARKAIRWIDQNLPAGGARKLLSAVGESPSLYCELYADRRAHRQGDADLTIIETAETLALLSGHRTVLATQDINMRTRASVYGVEARRIELFPESNGEKV